jgi:MipA family protein
MTLPRPAAIRIAAFALAAATGTAAARSDPLIGLLPNGGAGVGLQLRLEPSQYRGDDRTSDVLPLLMYDSQYFYVQSYRAGLKLEHNGWRSELFVKRRFEGFASNHVPGSMEGMDKRAIGGDLGIGTEHALGAGTAYVELLHDASNSSDGTELRFGYRYEGWWNGEMRWRPYVTFSWRDAKLNNYYYGVRPAEAAPGRPAYEAGSGFGFEVGMLGVYRINANWQAYGSFSVLLPPSAVRDSPVVEDRQLTPSATLGLMYSFEPQRAPLGDRKPLIMRAFYGGSSECDLMPIMTLQCNKTHGEDGTSVAALEVGQTLVKGLNGWPVDIAGFVGLLRHLEDGNQDDFWQLQAYFKAYYYGFPWRETVRTRIGFGFGLAYASHIPFGEQRDQALRGRDTSKLLLYLDPSIDVNVGDLVRAKSLRETYLGLGVSHRSGMFGSAKLFNNVDGGSNYIYAYLEWLM